MFIVNSACSEQMPSILKKDIDLMRKDSLLAKCGLEAESWGAWPLTEDSGNNTGTK